MADHYCIHCGEKIKEPPLGDRVSPELPVLSQREQDVTRLILSGYTEGQMADALFITVGTVKTYKRNIFKKLGIHSRRELFSAIYGPALPTDPDSGANIHRPIFCPACHRPLAPDGCFCGACGYRV